MKGQQQIEGTAKKCGNRRCGKPLDPTRYRNSAYCDGKCRKAEFDQRKFEREREEARIAYEQTLAHVLETHHDEWVTFLRDHLPTNSRVTATHIEALYEAMKDTGMIDTPFVQQSMFDRHRFGTDYGRGRSQGWSYS